MPFEPETFNCVISNAVLEHVVDLDCLASELHRVLCPGGVADLRWHNWYCPSGCHRPRAEWTEKPWGHLTGELVLPADPFLNRATPDDIKQVFARRFDVLRVTGVDRQHRLRDEDPDFEFEGRDLLTSAVKEKLVGFDEDLLTTRGFVLQCRKP